MQVDSPIGLPDLEGIASNILSARLKLLAKSGLVTREDDPANGRRVVALRRAGAHRQGRREKSRAEALLIWVNAARGRMRKIGVMPFTPDQFFEVFRLYNHTLWPVQLLLYAPAAAALAAILVRPASAGRVVSASLAILWLWTGAVYHLGFFAAINPAASLFAALSVAGAGMFLWHGAVLQQLKFVRPKGATGWIAIAVILYALLIYPAIGWFAGHSYWESPTFGAPCPTTIFTLGVLMLAQRPCPAAVLVAPVAWALVGTLAAISLGVPQDYGLAAAVLAALSPRLSAPQSPSP